MEIIMKTLIILCCAVIGLSGCVVSPLYGVDGRYHSRSYERRDRDYNYYHDYRYRDSREYQRNPYRN